jgi:peptidoglycan/xylan/chitin deacetylase (PgdA/CDA1 family)
VRRIFADGHGIGTHSEDHPLRFGKLPPLQVEYEIDKGIIDVGAALGDSRQVAPFFRVPGLAHSDAIENELAARHLIWFGSDTVADDWHHRISPKKIIALAMSRLEARGKGILLLHDIHRATAVALPGILKELKDRGFHVVQVASPSVNQY